MKTRLWWVMACVLAVILVCSGRAVAADAPPAPGASGDTEALKLELPEPYFGGTPCPYWGPNLEVEDYKDRPPVMVPKGTALLSRGKPVTASVKSAVLGDLKQITDGEKGHEKGSMVELPSGTQWIQIDLQEEHAIQAVLLWHQYKDKWVYFDLVIQLSNDPDFATGVTTIYNNDYDNSAGRGAGKNTDKEYIEKDRGRLIMANGVPARYVRCYSTGNSDNDKNHYVEVEVFGK